MPETDGHLFVVSFQGDVYKAYFTTLPHWLGIYQQEFFVIRWKLTGYYAQFLTLSSINTYEGDSHKENEVTKPIGIDSEKCW